jgi:hypothetical protein
MTDPGLTKKILFVAFFACAASSDAQLFHDKKKTSPTGTAKGVGPRERSPAESFACSKAHLEGLLEVNRRAQEIVLGRGGKGNEAFAETFASDRLLATPEILAELNAIFDAKNPFGKPRGVFLQPWGKTHVLKVSFEAPQGHSTLVTMRSAPGSEFGKVTALELDYEFVKGPFSKTAGPLCENQVREIGVASLRPNPSLASPVKSNLVTDVDPLAKKLVTGVEQSRTGSNISSVSRTTTEVTSLAGQDPTQKNVVSSTGYTIAKTPLPATSATVKSESKLSAVTPLKNTLSYSGAALETKVTSKLKTQVSAGYSMLDTRFTDVNGGLGTEYAFDEKVKVMLNGGLTDKVTGAAQGHSVGGGLIAGDLTTMATVAEARDSAGNPETRTQAVTSSVKLASNADMTVGLTRAEVPQAGTAVKSLSAGVNKQVGSGSVSLSGSREIDASNYTANLSVKLPWPFEDQASARQLEAARASAKPKPFSVKRKEIALNPVNGKWVYVIRYYDDRGDKRGEFFTSELAPESFVPNTTQ